MTHPFELNAVQLDQHIEEMVDATFADLQSQFLTLPRGTGFIDYDDFQAAYEVLKRETDAFAVFTEDTVWKALCEDALALVVLRTILGFSPVLAPFIIHRSRHPLVVMMKPIQYRNRDDISG